ncbi:MAG: hypothetical protein AAF827_14815, partial [Cyanobacteria bacterium P01_D01_bin.6]
RQFCDDFQPDVVKHSPKPPRNYRVSLWLVGLLVTLNYSFAGKILRVFYAVSSSMEPLTVMLGDF